MAHLVPIYMYEKSGNHCSRTMRALTDLKNQVVHFRVHDIYLPALQEILNVLHGNDILEGKVVDLTDSGLQKNAFVVVKVEGVKNFVIVPVEKVIDLASGDETKHVELLKRE